MRFLTLVLLALVAVSTTAAAAEDFQLTLRAGSPPQFTGAGIQATLVNETVGQRVELRLTDTTHRERLVGLIVSDGYFSVARTRQVVPKTDNLFFEEVAGSVDDAAAYARILNITKAANPITYRVAFPLNASATAKLEILRDVAPPTFHIGTVRNVTHYSFFLETTTDEFAFGDLRIRPSAGGEEVVHPTPQLALLQRFPIQGLKPSTTYDYTIHFQDWAGNVARSANYSITTLAQPKIDGPIVTYRYPSPDAKLQTAPLFIEARYEPRTGAIDPQEHVRLFVDKTEVSDRAVRETNRTRYEPAAGFGPGSHSVAFEISDAAGGFTLDRWTFTVGGAAGPTVSLGLLAVALLVLAATLRRRV